MVVKLEGDCNFGTLELIKNNVLIGDFSFLSASSTVLNAKYIFIKQPYRRKGFGGELTRGICSLSVGCHYQRVWADVRRIESFRAMNRVFGKPIRIHDAKTDKYLSVDDTMKIMKYRKRHGESIKHLTVTYRVNNCKKLKGKIRGFPL